MLRGFEHQNRVMGAEVMSENGDLVKVCEAADLQVAAVGGFYAPGSSVAPQPRSAVPTLPGQLAPRAMTPPAAPPAAATTTSVVLEPRPPKAW